MNDTATNGSIERDRLASLIEFAMESARLKVSPASAVAQHKLFALYEEDVQGRLGLTLNGGGGTEDGEEIWLSVARLHETKPPVAVSAMLKPWLSMTQGPEREPTLLSSVLGSVLIASGTHKANAPQGHPGAEQDNRQVDPVANIPLVGFAQEAIVRGLFDDFLNTPWRPWAEEEKKRRWTIKLYGDLFTLKQQLEGSIVESQIELVWGAGLGLWTSPQGIVSYPLVTRAAALSLNPFTQAIEVRPVDADARPELDWYSSVDNVGVQEVEKAAKEFFGKATTTFSPFDRGTFEVLLKSAVTHLDSNGVYWPNAVPPDDRMRPKPNSNLCVTDTWVLFARPRNMSVLIQDLLSLKGEVENRKGAEALPAAVKALVTAPSTGSESLGLPSFRGVSATYGGGSDAAGGSAKPQDLYFPKPFNDEQVRIIQLLERYQGVVVQGPPGTGKTHTIANVICHYLANGKSVLVTSMKDPALGVLQDQLPAEIRPLAISLLATEPDGMKQFEHAIQKIAAGVQALDKVAYASRIRQLDDSIDALHGKLARGDRAISDWAQKNLQRIDLDGEEIDPQDAAREVVAATGKYEWIEDRLDVGPTFAPQVSDADIVTLRAARRELGPDLVYLGASVPQVVELPESKTLLQAHQDLSRFTVLSREIEQGTVPALADSAQETLNSARALLADIDRLQSLRDDVITLRRSWTVGLRATLAASPGGTVAASLERLGSDLRAANDERKAGLDRPVATPLGMDLDAELGEAVTNLIAGRSPFGISGLFGKSDQKKALAQVTLLSRPPQNTEGWGEVARHLALQRALRDLAARWNALAPELKIEPTGGTEPQHGTDAYELYEVYLKVKETVLVEQRVTATTANVFPNWARAGEVAAKVDALRELGDALRHHVAKNQLADVWAFKEKVQANLAGRSGPVVEQIRAFAAETLGNPAVADAELQARWSVLTAEVARVNGFGSSLVTVADVAGRFAQGGAPKLANRLREPLTTASDPLLPDNWRTAWRLRRLTTHLESIDAQAEIKKLSADRAITENDLARAYQQVVVTRTWLRLAENASPAIRAALQAYLAAIQRIGRGTGKRAVRYRQDARAAARLANPAVPCWIMPHYKVSESLPPQLGVFDLVIIDEASQSDFTALPALLRAKKVLIVGDDKQVSPEAVGLEEAKVRNLMTRFLADQVPTFRPLMSPERSIYDLYRVVFAQSGLMLREHFRCVAPIIEYSKREFYNHELEPLRAPKYSERFDPPLIDVFVGDGFRTGNTNSGEAQFIVEEFGQLIRDPRMQGRTIGVVSLLGSEQAQDIWDRLVSEYGPEALANFKVACGDAYTFQGKERSVMFLSMVHAMNVRSTALSRDTFAQRFNVAASRAQDRMYLVRSVSLDDLSEMDVLRRNLIQHFTTPFYQDQARVGDLRRLCESDFEREVYDMLAERGYWVQPQVQAGRFRIDMVVEGHNDARLAIECDGDRYHGPERWGEDMLRQRVLERAGWVFWRCFASAWVRRRPQMMEELVKSLDARGIEPVGPERAPQSVHTESRTYHASQREPGGNT